MRKKAERQLPLDFAGALKLTKDWYERYSKIHAILEAVPAVTDLVHADLEPGQKKAKFNDEGVASETILRMAMVQQIEGLSFREVIIRIDDSNMLRFFCKFYDDAMIAHSTYAKLVNLIQPATWEKINEIIVRFGRDKKGIKGEKLRLDSTAVETDIHHPNDAALLYDCVRVLGRLIGQVRLLAPELVGLERAQVRRAKQIALTLGRETARRHQATFKRHYRNLLELTEKHRAWAERVVGEIEAAPQGADMMRRLELKDLAAELRRVAGLSVKGMAQAQKRVIDGCEVPNVEKIFSIFEPHTELLIRGKARAKVEFGHMVEIHEVEGCLISYYHVHEKRPDERLGLLEAAVHKHQELFGRVPTLQAADKGFYLKAGVEAVANLGVAEVCVPKRGKRNKEEEAREHSRWFKLGQAFRAGIEGTISVLKRVFGLSRCLREGFTHFASWVGSGVLAHNLVALART